MCFIYPLYSTRDRYRLKNAGKKILHDLQAANPQSGSKTLRRIINTSKITVEKKSAGSEKIR